MAGPILRFKADNGRDYPKWEVRKIIHVSDRMNVGFVGSCECYTDTSGIPFYRTGNLQNGKLIENDMKYVLKNFHEANKKSQLHKWDILIARHGNSGNAALYDSDAEANCSNIVIIRPNLKLVDPKFMVENINSASVQKQVRRLKHGSMQVVLNTKSIGNLDVGIPSLPEQRKIAEFLSTINIVIEKQTEIVSAWEERKKGVMQKLFRQEVRFKTDDGREFPAWKEKQIDDIATCFAGATPSTRIPKYWEDGTIRWMNSGEVNNRQIYDTEKRISQLGFDACSTKMVKSNTVVMALAGQGKTRGMVGITRVPLCTNQALCAIETNNDICDDYLYQYLQTQYHNLRRISSGNGTNSRLNLKLVGGYVVPIPCRAEQQKIADCLSSLDAVIEKQKATLAAWKELKKGLLQQMFV